MTVSFPLASALALIVFIIIEPTPYLVLMLAAAGLHEAGHLFAMKLCGVWISKITILPIGIDIRRDQKLLSYRKELMISASGPMVNLILFAVMFPYSRFFAYFNFLYGIFNLLPIKGLDGGEILTSALSFFFSPDTAAVLLRVISAVFCIFLWLAGVYILLILNGNLSIFALAVFLFVSVMMKK